MTEQNVSHRRSSVISGIPEDPGLSPTSSNVSSPGLLGSPFSKKNRMSLPVQYPTDRDGRHPAQLGEFLSRLSTTPNSRGSMHSTPYTPTEAVSSPRPKKAEYQGTPAPSRPRHSLDGKSVLPDRSSNRHSMIEYPSLQSSPEPSIRPASRSESLRSRLSMHRRRLSSTPNSPKDARGSFKNVDVRTISAPTQVIDPGSRSSDHYLALTTTNSREKKPSRSKLGMSIHLPGLGLGFGQGTIPEPRIPARRRSNRNSIPDAASLLDIHGTHSPFRLDELHKRVVELEYEANANRADLEILLSQEAEIAELREELNRARISQSIGDKQADPVAETEAEDKDKPASLRSHNSSSSYETAGGTCSTRPSWPGSADADAERNKSWSHEVKQALGDQHEPSHLESPHNTDYFSRARRSKLRNEVTGSSKLLSAPASAGLGSPQTLDPAKARPQSARPSSKADSKEEGNGRVRPPQPDLSTIPGISHSHMRSLSYGTNVSEVSPKGPSRLSDSLLHPGLTREENDQRFSPRAPSNRSSFSFPLFSDTMHGSNESIERFEPPDNSDLKDKSRDDLVDTVSSLRRQLADEAKRAHYSESKQHFLEEQLVAAKSQIDTMRASRDTLRRQIAAYQNSLNCLEEELRKEKVENKRVYQDLITRETELSDLKLSFEERLLDDFRAADAALTMTHF